ncbi:formate dehydrogenase accessory sulfurtransferase FdhD [Ferrimonas balearica]|uniref:formate dehydrogenase accessory sulfurtransferase FdhD n=1 Tax=Ferrimonas balearica TaxID=44012 RepID=UPI001C973622|nr:formate dehydrogenase accessory sulfurtransferase FdhD [Ferrimonas balearica]MBY5979443.1 formate dehydrogenase accessory sulfurtransferase FdhD [Ferrimonas balearica]
MTLPISVTSGLGCYRHYEVVRYAGGHIQPHAADTLASEVPIALVYNGISHAVMMGTGQDLEDLAYGFSLTEGIIDAAMEIYGVEAVSAEQGISLHIELAGRRFEQLKRARRNLSGRTGCGICGTEQLQQVVRPLPPVANQVRMSLAAIDGALELMQQQQSLHRLTGSMHAAALMDTDGALLALREDVGRHMALDKLIGHQLRQGGSPKVVLVSSRASFEMVHKAACAGVEIVLSVSAATERAVETAKACGVTLAGFCRPGRLNIYTYPERIDIEYR